MRDFQLVLNDPPRKVYLPGMIITGTVFAVNDEPKNYKAINVKIAGFAHVQWTESRGRTTEIYKSHEDYITTFVNVWDKDTSAGGGQFPVGSYQFPFSLPLIGNNIPASYEGSVGRIRYTIEARVVKDGLLKRDIVCESIIKVENIVKINRPNLLQPQTMEIQKTLCCLCCASGPIVITTSIPRTGYCVGLDSIPMEISVENGSSQQVRQIIVSIHKLVNYTAQGNCRIDRRTLATIASEPIRAHNTIIWQPSPLAIPDTPATLTNCGILQVTYYLQIKATISWAINPSIKIPIFLGNVPLLGTESTPQPIIPPPQHGLEPHPPLETSQPQTGSIPYSMPLQSTSQSEPSGFIPRNPFSSRHSYHYQRLHQLPPGFVDPIK